MATQIDICNMALSAVRAGPIDDINENSVESVQCSIYYNQARDWCLTEFAWDFAKSEKALALVSDASSQEWTYVYDYPTDCLRAMYIIPPNNGTYLINSGGGYIIAGVEYPPIPFAVGYGSTSNPSYILTNYENAYLAYTKRVTSEQAFNALFVDMMAAKLATYLAMPLGGDSGKYYREEAKRALQEFAGIAHAHAANQGAPQEVKAANAIKAYDGVQGGVYQRDDGSYGVY